MKWFLLIVLSSILVFHSTPAFAFPIASTFFGSSFAHATLGTIYNPIIRFVYILGGLMILVSFLYGGFKIIQGTPKDLEEGRNIIFYAFVGILLLVSIYWIVEIVGMLIGSTPLTPTI